MLAPVSLPTNDAAAPEKIAGEISSGEGGAPGCRPASTGRTVGAALQPRARDPDVSCRQLARCASQHLDEHIARADPAHAWARLVGPAHAINLPCSNTSQPNARTLSAPYRPISVPHCSRSAGEGLPGGYDGKHGNHSQPIPSPSRSSLREYPGSPARTGAAPAAWAAEQLA